MEKKPGFKTGWCSARDVPTIEPLQKLRNTPVKGLGFAPPLSLPAQRIIADLRQQLAEAKARIAELEGEQ